MWKHWSEVDEAKRKAWMTAGTLLWEVTTVQQSNVIITYIYCTLP
jgi:hypothetical protein